MTAPPDDRETLAEWMRDRYATGHGDSVRDLLKELTWQIEERVSAAREEGRRQGAREMREAILAGIDRCLTREQMVATICALPLSGNSAKDPPR